MCTYLDSVNLIRYLLVWRVNSSLVRLPPYLPAELSAVLGEIIADRLPTSKARRWRKSLAAWGERRDEASGKGKRSPENIPEVSWPMESTLLVYPGKTTYGVGELILWELKLIGDSADHGFFLEVLLPAMEEASYTSDPRWHRPNRLWGQFDIQSIYVARGLNWEPLVRESRLDLRYRATPIQWKEGLTFGLGSESKFSSPTRLVWLTPFDLSHGSDGEDNIATTREEESSGDIPTLHCILAALRRRMCLLIPDLRSASHDTVMRMEGQSSIRDVIEQMDHVPVIHSDLRRPPRGWPGHRIGTQVFSRIPSLIIPYLELASIFHIGRHSHMGCGTFTLLRSTSEIA